jgi:hypothetical protein
MLYRVSCVLVACCSGLLSPSISTGCRVVIAGLLNPNPEARTRLEVSTQLEADIMWLCCSRFFVLSQQSGSQLSMQHSIAQGLATRMSGMSASHCLFASHMLLQDLATCNWLTHSAAAHTAQLSHLTSRFEPTNLAIANQGHI